MSEVSSLLDRIRLTGIIPTVSVEEAGDVVPVCRALLSAGLDVAEITLRTERSMEALATAAREFPQMLIGVGTILDVEQAEEARRCGAAFHVTPGANPRIMKYCADEGLDLIPGCTTGGEIELARSFGFRVVKIFPAESLGGVAAIKSFSAPYRDMSFVPMGGVSETNLGDYISLPQVAACGGSWIAANDLVTRQDYAEIEARAARALQAMFGLQLAHVGINAEGESAAESLAGTVAGIIGKSVKSGRSSLFVGTDVEVMKAGGRGDAGHIAFRCNSLERLRWRLERAGLSFDESTAKYKDGRLHVIYLSDGVGPFAIHFVQA